jgi:hypothetical protein
MSSSHETHILFETVISNEMSAAMSWKEVGAARKDRDAVSKFLEVHDIELLREMTGEGVHFAALIPLNQESAAIIEGLVELTEKPFFTKILASKSTSLLSLDEIRKVQAALDKWDAKFGVS